MHKRTIELNFKNKKDLKEFDDVVLPYINATETMESIGKKKSISTKMGVYAAVCRIIRAGNLLNDE